MRPYITIEGKVKEYTYVKKNYKDQKHKPRCPKCGNTVHYIYFKNRKVKKLGFICIECNTVYIDNNYNILGIKKI